MVSSVRAFALAVLALGCSSSSSSGLPAAKDGGTSSTTDGSTTTPAEGPAELAKCVRDPGAPPPREIGSADPTGGAAAFTLEMALEGFAEKTGKLTAAITTEKGVILCRLSETEAPISVANFVGLARGTRPFKEGTTWKTGRFYDGKIWHRVIPGFVIQGGDPLGTGTGGPGYALPQENHTAQDKGVLAMAASDQPSGSQFYIVTGKGPDPDYNVFGMCETPVAEAIAAVERDSKDRPKVPVHMSRIDIARCP
jgi:peptidyl-prolyl cis-trans isomerase A (cyclophilin A)